ncbi:probable anion transporter 5 [Tanacetum coccineum]
MIADHVITKKIMSVTKARKVINIVGFAVASFALIAIPHFRTPDVMGVSNTAGTLAGIIGVRLKGQLLEAAKAIDSDLSSPDSWRAVFFIPGLLCILNSVVFLLFSNGKRIFD